MSLVESWVYALWKEGLGHKGKMVIVFAIITTLVVLLGFVWPKTYESNAVVFADEQNIIQPLLSGSAEVTRPDVEQAAIARDRILSNRILGQALVEAKLVKNTNDETAMASMIRSIRGGVVVSDAGRGHIRIAYRAEDANMAFTMASAITNAFILDSSQTKRKESREAFEFIDNQVKTYKEQLQEAEEKLKNFKSANASSDGVGGVAVQQGAVDSLELELQLARTRRDELRRQLSQESQNVTRQYKADAYRERLAQAQSQLDTLRLSYNDTYPDIVSLRQQIQDLQKAIVEAENEPVRDEGHSNTINPVYSRLRGDLADAEVMVRTLEMKLASARRLLGSEQGRSKERAEYEALLAELTRDYNVTKQMYENMLGRKERARLSVALDVEGQGVTYKIKEPPAYPSVPIGVRFIHFFLLAPLVGVLAPLALLVAYIQLDPRIRFVEKLEYALPESVPVLAVVSHMYTPSERRVLRSELGSIAIFIGVVMVVYAAVALLRLSGVI